MKYLFRIERYVQTTTMNKASYYKQLLVNSLELPRELCNEINGYLFYDKESMQVRNEFRMRICGKIHKSIGNRRADSPFRGETEDWVFFADYGEPYISAVNCRFCGNYIMSKKHINNHNMLCFCDRELREYEALLQEDCG